MSILWFGVVLIALVCVTSSEVMQIQNKGWWKNAVFYQIYPRSFKDGNNDGIGDLEGITEKLDYLFDIGVDAIWLSPIFSSPMKDFGYDISDFTAIHKDYGTMADFELMMEKAKSLDIKMILDLVPNHTSDEHEWFKKALKGDAKYQRYYVFIPVDASNPDKLPNNWLSVFGGPAWEKVDLPVNGIIKPHWYLHQFLSTQPDLNFESEEVHQEMKEIMHFWLDKGVDGFRVDAVPHIYESPGLEDEPEIKSDFRTDQEYGSLDHIHTKDLEATYLLVQEWREILDKYSLRHNSSEKVIMAEIYSPLPYVVKYYKFGTHVPFNVEFVDLFKVRILKTVQHFKDTIDAWGEEMEKANLLGPDYVFNWVIGNHDNARVATRFPGHGDRLVILSMILPNIAVTYNGEELGMENLPNISYVDTQDPFGINAGPEMYEKFSRDPERSPFQWDNSTNAGFNDGAKPWLPIHPNYRVKNVKDELNDPCSDLWLYKNLITMRKRSKALAHGGLKTCVQDDKALIIVRDEPFIKQPVILVINFSEVEEQTVNIEPFVDECFQTATVAITSLKQCSSSRGLEIISDLKKVKIPAGASYVLELNPCKCG